MNSIPRMSRLIVAAIFMAGSPGSVFAAGAITPALANSGGARTLPAGAKILDKGARVRILSGFAARPMSFEKNIGQTDKSVKFFSRASGYNLFLTPTEAVMVLAPAKTAKDKAGAVVRMKLKGANAAPAVSGVDLQAEHSSYWLGNDRSKWVNGAEHYAQVKFRSVYPGIDMVYYVKQGQIEHDFIVAPGASPDRILVSFEGARSLKLDAQGNLMLGVDGGQVTYKAPSLYQMSGSKRVHVNGRFMLAGKNAVRIAVGDYIKTKALIIDPALAYSNFLGGATSDQAYSVAVDNAGNAYVTGTTDSVAFPTAGTPIQAAKGTGFDVFVTKVNPAGTALVWSTYLGGAGSDIGYGIAVDPVSQAVFVAGDTTDGTTFPHVGTYGTGVLTGFDAFVVGINAAGTATLFSKVFGGGADDHGYGITIDGSDNVFVTGMTTSIAAGSFPTTAGAVEVNAGGGASQGFVSEFSVAGALLASTYVGGTGACQGNAIALDSGGKVYVTGNTTDGFLAAATWPTVFKNTVTGAGDAFIAILAAGLASYTYETYVGGSGPTIDNGTGIAVDAGGNVYIAGTTGSADFPGAGFVTVGQTTYGGGPADGFIFKLHPGNPGGGTNDGVYATYLGGNGNDVITGLKVDVSGDAYMSGWTTSPNFPSVGANASAGQATFVGTPEAFVAMLGPTGATVGLATWFGGTGATYGQGLALDSSKNIYLAGYTNSGAGTFPLVAGGFQQAYGGGLYDAFISKFGSVTPPPSCTITSLSPNSGFTVGGTTVTINGTGFAGLLAPGITFGTPAASTYTVVSPTRITALSPAEGASSVTLTVKAGGGSCTSTYIFAVAGAGNGGACGAEFFYPSPATGPTGTFQYCMSYPGTMRVRVYNSIGDIVAKVEDATAAGGQSAHLNTSRLAPGVYLYLLDKDYGGGNVVHLPVQKFVVKH